MSSSNAMVKWAQRKDKLFITLEVTDATEVDVKFTETTIEVTGNGKHKVGATAATPFTTKLILSHEIDPAQSGHKVGGHAIQVLATKKDATAPFWEKLTQESPKALKQWLSADWALWVDEDEKDEKGLGAYGDMGNFDMGGMGGMGGLDQMLGGMGGMGGLGGMGGMGGLGGMGGMGGGDSDDEDGAAADLGDLEGDEKGEGHGHSHAEGEHGHSHAEDEHDHAPADGADSHSHE